MPRLNSPAEPAETLVYQEFLQLFLREERTLAAFLLSSTGNVHLADDLLQNVACTLWKKRGEYDQARPFRAWALGMAQIEVLRARQQRARSREVLADETVRLLAESAAEQAPELDDRYQFLSECLPQLADTARQVVDLKYGHARSIQDIATRLHKTVAAVEMILVRSRRALRECIERKLAIAVRGG